MPIIIIMHLYNQVGKVLNIHTQSVSNNLRPVLCKQIKVTIGSVNFQWDLHSFPSYLLGWLFIYLSIYIHIWLKTF